MFLKHANQYITDYSNTVQYIHTFICAEVGWVMLPFWHSARGADGRSWSSALFALFREGQVEESDMSQEDPSIPCFRPDK